MLLNVLIAETIAADRERAVQRQLRENALRAAAREAKPAAPTPKSALGDAAGNPADQPCNPCPPVAAAAR
jgi:hypothetical protein